MNFKLNPTKLLSTFNLPKSVVEEHIKLAGGTQLKVLLYCFNTLSEEINPNNIAAALKISVNDTVDALGFWSELGYFNSDETEKTVETTPKKVIKKEIIKPSREDIVDLAKNDDKIKFILDEAQKKFGRLLRANETSTLVWLYADEGLSPAVILMAIDYAKTIDKLSIGYIQKLCIDWLNNGVDTTLAAEERIKALNQRRTVWYMISSTFGLIKRSPSKKEEELADLCAELGYGREILKEAYSRTIDSIGEYNVKYILTIIKAWNKLGVKEFKDIEALENKEETKKQDKKVKEDYAGYDKEAYKKDLDEDYK